MVEELNIKIKYNLNQLKDFVVKQDLNFDSDIDLALVIKEQNKIIGCACKKGNIFKMIAIDSRYQNQDLVSQLVSELITSAHSKGVYHYFIFTKLIYENQFKSLGFNLLVSYKEIGLFEKGRPTFNEYYDGIDLSSNKLTGAIVMNCNPFTLGHQYLIDQALKTVQQLVVFIVEEDKSFFKFSDRIKLVKESLKDYDNVIVVASGPYIISQATFPTYFLKEYDDFAQYYTNIDIKLFMRIMEKLNITYRFVGEEPYDKLTDYYNQQLEKNLKDKLVIIERKKNNDGYISASKVRKLLDEKKYLSIKEYVNSYVYEFLESNYFEKVDLND